MDIISPILKYLYFLGLFLDSLGRFLVPWATVIGIIVACWTFRRNTLLKRMELINKIYGRFLEDELYGFYTIIRKKEVIDWQHDKKDERLLNESLTLFDEVNYLQTQGLAWEYIASEIQYFASNDTVWDYMIQRIQECKERRFPEDIMPFTGFPELLKKMPKEFRANPFPNTPDRYNALFNP
ncbi:MAG: hypothetical protein ABR913_06695 [Sedimentisphaerales bacterium]|jgi:hypothetical protein